MHGISLAVLASLFILSAETGSAGIHLDDAVSYPTGARNIAVLPGDYNGDGNIDLAACRGSLAFFPGNGDGTFQQAVVVVAFCRSPVCFGVADFDNDGDLDAVGGARINLGLPELWGDIYVSRNLGGFVFQNLTCESNCFGVCPGRMCCADFDCDGDIDVAVTETEDDVITFCKNLGGGTMTYSGVFFWGRASDLCTDDLDNNGRYDIALVSYNTDSVHIVLNHLDTPRFLEFQGDVGDGPSAVRSGDVDADGIPDLVVANTLGNSVSVLFGIGDGSFSDHAEFPAGDAPNSLLPVDLDGDGDQEIVITNPNLNTISILENLGNRTFASEINYAVGTKPMWVCASDFDNDGDFDLAVANYYSEDVSVLINLSDTQTDALEPSDGTMLPESVSLSQNYPNPFNPNTTMEFSLTHRSYVTLTIHNILGQEIRRLVDLELAAGFHVVEWDGRDQSGEQVSTGVYLYRLKTDAHTVNRKMLLLR